VDPTSRQEYELGVEFLDKNLRGFEKSEMRLSFEIVRLSYRCATEGRDADESTVYLFTNTDCSHMG
jgi:hypothetical protein